VIAQAGVAGALFNKKDKLGSTNAKRRLTR
jgi:hypothetical protein